MEIKSDQKDTEASISAGIDVIGALDRYFILVNRRPY